MHSWKSVAVIFCVGLLLWAMPALAGESDPGITVIGTGIAKGKPSIMQFEANVSGNGELASDAKVKYEDAKKKGLAALDGLKNPNLTVEANGPSVTDLVNPQLQMQMMNGMAVTPEKSKVMIAEQLKIQIKGIDALSPAQILETLLKIIDTCHDAGLQIGPPTPTNYYQMQIMAQSGAAGGLVVYKIPDKTSLEDQAYQLAVDDARAKAEKIAKLSGVKLGRVLSVLDNNTAASGPKSQREMVMAMMGQDPGVMTTTSSDKSVSSPSPGEIPVAASVTVTFEIAK
jgi:uncharacterized protein YggE